MSNQTPPSHDLATPGGRLCWIGGGSEGLAINGGGVLDEGGNGAATTGTVTVAPAVGAAAVAPAVGPADGDTCKQVISTQHSIPQAKRVCFVVAVGTRSFTYDNPFLNALTRSRIVCTDAGR